MAKQLDGQNLPKLDDSFLIKRLDDGDVAQLGKDFNVIFYAKVREQIEKKKAEFAQSLKSGKVKV